MSVATQLALSLTASQLVDAATMVTAAKDSSGEERAQCLVGARQLMKQARLAIQRIEAAELGHRVPA